MEEDAGVMITPISIKELKKVGTNKTLFAMKNKRDVEITYESEDVRDEFYNKFDKIIKEFPEKNKHFEFQMFLKREKQTDILKEQLEKAAWERNFLKYKRLTDIFAFCVVSSHWWLSKFKQKESEG